MDFVDFDWKLKKKTNVKKKKSHEFFGEMLIWAFFTQSLHFWCGTSACEGGY